MWRSRWVSAARCGSVACGLPLSSVCFSFLVILTRALPLPLFCVCVPRSYGLVLWPGPCTFNNAERRAQAHLYHGLSAVVHCACIKTQSHSSILLHLNLMYLFFVRRSIAQSCSSSMRRPTWPKISIIRPPPIHIFISLMISLGVGKSQTDEVSLKSARISP
jgi:hypothetical protein